MHEVVSTKFSRLSEAKLTPHLAQKKYWEDKASDARDEFDDMGVLDDSILRSRVPSVRMWDDNIDLSPKRRNILRLVLLPCVFVCVSACACTCLCVSACACT